MNLELYTLLSITCLILNSKYAFSTPVPKPHHEVHVDLIDSIFQIPIQTLGAVRTLLKNVHDAKRKFLSINVQVGHPNSDHKPEGNGYYPSKKPEVSTKPSSGGYPELSPDTSRPLLPESSSSRPVSGTTELLFPNISKPIDIDNPSYGSTIGSFGEGGNELGPSSLGTTSSNPEITISYFTELQTASSSARPYLKTISSSSKPIVQPLSLDLPSAMNQNTIKEKNFKEYVQRKLAERNSNDNRINIFK